MRAQSLLLRQRLEAASVRLREEQKEAEQQRAAAGQAAQELSQVRRASSFFQTMDTRRNSMFERTVAEPDRPKDKPAAKHPAPEPINEAEFMEFMVHNLKQKHRCWKLSHDMDIKLQTEKQRRAFEQSRCDFPTYQSYCDKELALPEQQLPSMMPSVKPSQPSLNVHLNASITISSSADKKAQTFNLTQPAFHSGAPSGLSRTRGPLAQTFQLEDNDYQEDPNQVSLVLNNASEQSLPDAERQEADLVNLTEISIFNKEELDQVDELDQEPSQAREYLQILRRNLNSNDFTMGLRPQYYLDRITPGAPNSKLLSSRSQVSAYQARAADSGDISPSFRAPRAPSVAMQSIAKRSELELTNLKTLNQLKSFTFFQS